MKSHVFLFAALTLSACGSSIEIVADTNPYGILLPEGQSAAAALDTYTSGLSDSVSGVGSANYALGEIDGRNAVVSGHYASSTPGAVPSSNATFTGNYKLGVVTESTASPIDGTLTLNVDVASSTISGLSDDNKLIVNGTFAGNDMSGTVEFQGLDGDLDGVLSTSGAVGAFAGADANGGYAGILAVQ